MTTRIDRRFAALKAEGRAALVTFVMTGDPDYDTSLAVVKALPKAGADVIELGMPFTDPMADGPAIQAAGLRALAGGQTLIKTIKLVREFRASDNDTPVVLMGYYNPIYIYGVDRFLVDAKAAGVDGLIVVDLPPEEDEELCIPSLKAGLNFIRPPSSTTRRALCTTCRSRELPARLRPMPARFRLRSIASNVIRSCRSRSASACAQPNRPVPSPKTPMVLWSVRPSSMPCAAAWIKRVWPVRIPSRLSPIWYRRWPRVLNPPAGFPRSSSIFRCHHPLRRMIQ